MRGVFMKKILISISYLIFFVLGGLTFTHLTSTEATTNGLKTIGVYEGTALKYYVDNVKKIPPAGQEGFVYQGTTYVPLRFLAESLGEEVTWDGKTWSIYIGDKPQGTVTYMQDLTPHTSSGTGGLKFTPKTVVTNMGETFNHSSYTVEWNHDLLVHTIADYLTNGQYKKFEAYLAPTNYWKGKNKVDNIGYLKVYADDKLVYDSGTISSDATEKVKVSADLDGALRVKIELNGAYLGLLDAKFITK